MKKTNIIWLIFGIALIVLLAIWLTTDKQEPEIEVDTEVSHEDVVREYIQENISELSPEPEVLGGTFYVTNIDFIEEDLILVEYEDGHIALEANAKYSIINDEVVIDYFRLKEETVRSEEEFLNNEELVYNYIEQNISELSPEPEVLGGTFHVTSIDFIDDNLAIVEYEDGHIALEAQVIYSVVNNRVNINSFQILQNEEDLVINYIEDNISELSPEDAVLGGTFYVTNINFVDENLAIVEYEDGHIALKAEATYSVADNQVSIESFQIIEDENGENNEIGMEDEDLVYSYIEDNISELSPEEATLGGSFYVTSIDFVEDDIAIVDYEDGHVAFSAKATFSVNDNEVEINSFEIIPDGSTIERE